MKMFKEITNKSMYDGFFGKTSDKEPPTNTKEMNKNFFGKGNVNLGTKK